MAWNKKFLRVNLSTGSCKTEALNMEWAQQYLGSRGLATKYLIEEDRPQGRSPVARQQAHHRPPAP
jgi:aldehyde:ferredoxin oxidoreductase